MAKIFVRQRSANGMGSKNGSSHQKGLKYLARVRESAIKRFQRAPLGMSAQEAVKEADKLVSIASEHVLASH